MDRLQVLLYLFMRHLEHSSRLRCVEGHSETNARKVNCKVLSCRKRFVSLGVSCNQRIHVQTYVHRRSSFSPSKSWSASYTSFLKRPPTPPGESRLLLRPTPPGYLTIRKHTVMCNPLGFPRLSSNLTGVAKMIRSSVNQSVLLEQTNMNIK